MSNYLIGDYIRDTRFGGDIHRSSLALAFVRQRRCPGLRPVHRHPANIFWTRYWKGLESEIKYSMFW